MSETSTKKKKVDSPDTTPWKVQTASGSNKRAGGQQETFATFKEADNAAKQFTAATGEYAQAVRS